MQQPTRGLAVHAPINHPPYLNPRKGTENKLEGDASGLPHKVSPSEKVTYTKKHTECGQVNAKTVIDSAAATKRLGDDV